MRCSKLYSSVALLLSALTPELAHAQLRDTQWVRPVMMLLVDTSGSMERKVDTSTCVDCLPSCNNNSATDERNRWAITLEALTGTFSNYACNKRDRSVYTGQYDVNYFLPHYEFTTLAPLYTTPAAQANDGVLDSYVARLKFGLMTFDGVSTTVNGATLVPWTTYSSVKSQILGMAGQYSYPDATANPDTSANTPSNAFGWKPLSFPGCGSFYGVNAGARGKGTAPGSLISVGLTDDQTSVATVNASIQTSLLQVRPYAGTPIAAMLDDLRYYLQNDTDINSNDPYYNCRPRYATLLTDGAPDQMFRGGTFNCDSTANSTCAASPIDGKYACQCPYDTEVSLAAKLTSTDKLKALYVVAFNVNDTSALSQLDNISIAGNGDVAYRADNLSALRTSLDKIFSDSNPDSTSRSVPIVLNSGIPVMLGGKQYQVTAGFRVGGGDLPWEGRLWRQRIECVNGVVTPQPLDKSKGDMFHETLNTTAGTSRSVYTVKPTAVLVNNNNQGTIYNQTATTLMLSTKTNVLKPDGLGNVSNWSESDPASTVQSTFDVVSSTPATFDSTMSPLYFDGTNATRDTIVNYVRGTPTSAYRASHKLGDIYHSNPAVLPPLMSGSDLLTTYDSQLRQFYMNLIDTTKTATGYWGHYGANGRPGAVFVATNDGVLHAFNLDDWTNKAGTVIPGGTEFWAFAPPALFNMMSSVALPSHQYVFDGTPIVKDVILNKDASNTTLGTILLVGLRGLAAYVALDVTWPDSPKFLWQRSFPYLGETVGTPQLATVRLKWNGVDQIRAVAILPGGNGTATGSACNTNKYNGGQAPNTGARTQVRCWGKRGRWLYVVDVLTGELVQEFDGRHFASAVTGSVAVDGEGVAVSRAAYFTDADGLLYRLSMVHTDPSLWRVMPIWDLYGGNATDFNGNTVAATSPSWQMGRGASYPPTLARDPATGNLTIVVGTGDVDNLTDTAANRVVSITEVPKIDSLGEIYGVNPTLNWALQLDAGESVTGPMVVLNDTLYFTSFTSPGNATDKCVMGTSRIVGGDVRKKDSRNLPVAGLTPESGTGAYVLQYKPSGATGNSLLLGLSIARDPICTSGSKVSDPINASFPGRTPPGNVSGGNYTMRSMVAGTGGSVMSGTTSTGDPNGQRQLSISMGKSTTVRSVGWANSVE